MMTTEGKVITCRAAVAWAAGEPFKIENIQVDPPKAGEVRLRIVATGIVRDIYIFLFCKAKTYRVFHYHYECS